MDVIERTVTPLEFCSHMRELNEAQVSDTSKLLAMSRYMALTLWDLGYCSGVDIFSKFYLKKEI